MKRHRVKLEVERLEEVEAPALLGVNNVGGFAFGPDYPAWSVRLHGERPIYFGFGPNVTAEQQASTLQAVLYDNSLAAVKLHRHGKVEKRGVYFQYTGNVAVADVRIDTFSENGTNLLGWADVSYQPFAGNGEGRHNITKVQVMINVPTDGTFRYSYDPNPVPGSLPFRRGDIVVDWQSVLEHELLHGLGLGHNDRLSDINDHGYSVIATLYHGGLQRAADVLGDLGTYRGAFAQGLRFLYHRPPGRIPSLAPGIGGPPPVTVRQEVYQLDLGRVG